MFCRRIVLLAASSLIAIALSACSSDPPGSSTSATQIATQVQAADDRSPTKQMRTPGAAQVQAGENHGLPKQLLRPAECERLVAQLVNPNKPPFLPVPHDPDYHLPDYDFRTQAKVKDAFDKLSDNIEAALPILMKHIDDQEFAYIYEDPSGGYVRFNVGHACRRIVQAHVEVHHSCFQGQRPFLFFIRGGCGGIERWWESRKGKPLAELQLEACEWVLGQKKPDWWFQPEESWSQGLQGVEQLVKQLRQSKKPIVIQRHIEFVRK
jgi:hypothetical protein